MSAGAKPTVLVTGANGLIGQAVARWFLERDGGAFVYLGVRRGRERADSLTGEFGDRTGLIAFDTTDPAAWTAAVSGVVGRHGRVDVLVNNAGFHRDHLLATMPPEDWDAVVRTNLDGVFHGCQAVVKTMMAQRGGRIVNVASLSALAPPAGQTNYAAAKAGVVALTRSLAREVARAGITVNAVCPGFIEDDAAGPDPGDPAAAEARKQRLRSIPMRRFGRPEDVAAAVGFLASQDAAYITGSTLKVDGGLV